MTATPPNTIEGFLERTTMREMASIPSAVMDEALTLAYDLYKSGRYLEAETMCRGLLAADHRQPYAYELYASVLLKQRRYADALVQVEMGLRYDAASAKLAAMRADLQRALRLVTELTTLATAARLGAANRAAQVLPAQTEVR